MMCPATVGDAIALDTLLAGLVADPVPPVRIRDLALDSRRIGADALFLACAGGRAHGLDFLAEVLEAGAAAIAWEPADGVRAPDVPAGVVCVAVHELSRHAGNIADRFFAAPTADMAVAGITGTNGKTTTAHLVAGAAEATGLPTASMGTLGVGRPGRLEPQSLTTPDAVGLHRALASLRDAGVTHAAIEVSSHALVQHRVGGVRFDTAVFTNLSRDHLDYHGDFAAYAAAKRSLFGWRGLRRAVVNAADPEGRRILRSLATDIDTVAVCPAGTEAPPGVNAIRGSAPVAESGGLSFAVRAGADEGVLRAPLIGPFNAENLLCALAVLTGWGVPFERALAAFETVGAPPGRMERFGDPERQPLIVVDYAHTPGALENALRALREHCTGRVFCVFGCGGERDRGKRPMMGALAARLADEIVLTDDNPRGENPDRIVADIAAGVVGGASVVTERDREAAIRLAFEAALPGDIVLVAGKGHEQLQEAGGKKRLFSDRDLAAALVGDAR